MFYITKKFGQVELLAGGFFSAFMCQVHQCMFVYVTPMRTMLIECTKFLAKLYTRYGSISTSAYYLQNTPGHNVYLNPRFISFI